MKSIESSRTENQNAASSEPAQTASAKVFALVALFALLEVMLGVFTTEKTIFLLKEQLGLAAGTVTNINLLVYLPYYCQAFIGAATQSHPLFGYRRRSYFALATLVSAGAWAMLGFRGQYATATTAACLLLALTGAATRYMLVNAVAVSWGNRSGNYKHIQTIQQTTPLLMVTLFAGRLGGVVTEDWQYGAAFGAAAVVSLCYLMLLPLIAEADAVSVSTSDDGVEPDTVPPPGTVAVLRGLVRDRRLWAVTAFVAYFGFIPSPETAQVYYFSDALHFSKRFVGELTAWGSAGSLLGILLVQFFPATLRLRRLALLSAVSVVLSYVPFILIQDPLSARVGMCLGGLLVSSNLFLYYWMWARACPKGSEAVVFGLLASTQSLFFLICDWLGTHMYDWFGPASGHSAAHGWFWTLVTCIILGLPLFLLLPFLPKNDPADDPEPQPVLSLGAEGATQAPKA